MDVFLRMIYLMSIICAPISLNTDNDKLYGMLNSAEDYLKAALDIARKGEGSC